VRVISRKALADFVAKHPDAAEPLDNWYRRTKKSVWKDIAQVRGDYPHTDKVGDCTIFNIGGNKYRLIVKIRYDLQLVFIRFVMTHAEYNKGGYKDDCNS
jgi:mRNA interferase HigB